LVDIILGVWGEKQDVEVGRNFGTGSFGEETKIVCSVLIISSGLGVWTHKPLNINILFGLSYSRTN
jgi:hypothetical protein